MKNTSLRSLLLAAAMFVGSSAFAADAPKEGSASVNRIISSLVKADYSAFVAEGDAQFKELKKEQFASVAAQVAPVLKPGYEVAYLGSLNQRGYHVSLWKISLKTGGDDLLATLSMKDGKVGGFYIR
ncbi:MAG: hypothetical protein WCR49_11440 [Opitutae bacterium]